MNRRSFLEKAAVTAGAVVLSGNLSNAKAAEQNAGNDSVNLQPLPTPETFREGEMIYRMLGSTGERVSAIGMGGSHIGYQATEAESIRLIRSGIDRGITFLDNCWDYNDGASEIRMGKALRDGYRQKIFLMTKIDGRDKKTAARQIDESLLRLQTDHVDLMQFHEVIRLEDPDKIFAEGGAFEAMTDAKKAGKVRFVGFTGHKDPSVHLRMLDTAAAHNFKFDAVQMPLNVMDAHFRSFEKQVLPHLVEQKIGVLGMKSIGSGSILQSNAASAPECLRYALTLPTSVVITGIDRMEILEQAITTAKNFQPMTETEISALLTRTKQAAMTGKFEKFKTDSRFDGTAKNPKWLGGA